MAAQRYQVIGPAPGRSWLDGLDQFEVTAPTLCSSDVVVGDPGWVIYGLDDGSRTALFTRSASIEELLAAPFFYRAQQQTAREVLSVPYQELNDLSDQLSDPDRLCLLYSTGRCGSTLLGQAMAATTGATVVSEPDAYTSLVGLQHPDGSADEELVQLGRSITRFLAHACRPVSDVALVIKFRGWCTHIADLLLRAQPDAESLFLTRDLAGWMRSMGRLIRIGDPEREEHFRQHRDEAMYHFPRSRFIRMPDATEPPASRLEDVTRGWVSLMRSYLEFADQGVLTGAIDYGRLTQEPHRAIEAVTAAYGMMQTDPGALDAVLAQDSQAGTPLSGRELARDGLGELSAADLETSRRIAARYGVDPDIIDRLPGQLL